MKNAELEPSEIASIDTLQEPTYWEPSISERHQTYVARLETTIRTHACDALNAWLYNSRMTIDTLCSMMRIPKNVGSRFDSVEIGNSVFALAILWLLGFRWEVLDTEAGCALTFLPRDKATIGKGVCWKSARVNCLQSLADALDMHTTIGKKSALTDVLGASGYLVYHHSPEASYITIELRSKTVAE